LSGAGAIASIFSRRESSSCESILSSGCTTVLEVERV
jgi:hypothetical protein